MQDEYVTTIENVEVTEITEIVEQIEIVSVTENTEQMVTNFEVSEILETTNYNEYYAERLDNIEDGMRLECGLLLFFFAMFIFISLYKFTRSLF